MTKLRGSLFINAMDFNEIKLSNGILKIHNSNGTGFGYMSQYKTTGTDELKFMLNKKDYSLLHTFDAFDVEVSENVVKVKADGFIAKFANIIDKVLCEPETSDMVDMGVAYSDIFRGKDFAGSSDKTKIMLDGVTILKDKIITANGFCFYTCETENKGPEINIPKEIFKMLNPAIEYKIMTNGKLVVFMQKGHAMYTTLIEVLIKDNTAPKDAIVEFKVNKGELISKLKVLKSYNNIVEITAVNGENTKKEEVVFKVADEGNEIEMSVPIEVVSLSKMHIAYSIESILKIVSIVDEDEVTLKLNENMMFVNYNKSSAVAARNTCKDMEVKA